MSDMDPILGFAIVVCTLGWVASCCHSHTGSMDVAIWEDQAKKKCHESAFILNEWQQRMKVYCHPHIRKLWKEREMRNDTNPLPAEPQEEKVTEEEYNGFTYVDEKHINEYSK